MSSDLKNKITNYATVACVLLIAIGGSVMMYPNFKRGRSLKAQNAELQECIDAKKREIAFLKECQRRFRTDADFVEAIARQNNRVFPGELVFLFDKD
jgi:cell division protein FtsB